MYQVIIALNGMSPHIKAIFRKVTKIRNLGREHNVGM